MSDAPVAAAAPPHSAAPQPFDAARGPLSGATLGWFLALLGWTTILCFWKLDAPVAFEPIDCWVAQTAREMRDGATWRSFIEPKFSGETRMQKSPGPYWVVVLTSRLRGSPVDEVSARIPNAIACVVLVATIFWLTRRIAGDRAAIFAGFAISCSALILHWSRSGGSDMGLTALVTLSLACLFIGSICEPPGPRRIALWLAGYFVAGVAMIYKMPMPLVCIGLPALIYVLLRNQWRIFASRWHLLGLLLFLLPWLPWVIAVLQLEPTAWQKWRVEFLDRFTGDLPNIEEQRVWYFYFYYLLPPIVYCLPFSLSLPAALASVFHVKQRFAPGPAHEGAIFCVVWFVSLVAFFTASTGKELRYLLPALPPLLVLLGCELARFFDPARRATPKFDRFVALAAWILVPVGLAAGTLGLRRWYKEIGSFEGFEWRDVLWPYVVTAAILAVGFCAAAWLYQRRRENAAFGTMVATMYAAWIWAWPNFVPVLQSETARRDFAAQLRASIPRDYAATRIKQIGFQDPRITWYSDYRFPRIIDQLKLLQMQADRGQRSLEWEKRTIAEEMIRQLRGAQPVLFVIPRPWYVEFMSRAPAELLTQGAEMPASHIWLQTQKGRQMEHVILLGNQPPPWPEPALNPPSERLAAARAELAARRAAGSEVRRREEPQTQPTDSGE